MQDHGALLQQHEICISLAAHNPGVERSSVQYLCSIADRHPLPCYMVAFQDFEFSLTIKAQSKKSSLSSTATVKVST